MKIVTIESWVSLVSIVNCIAGLILFKPCVPNTNFLYLLKTLENHMVFSCFQGVEKGCIGNKWVKTSCNLFGFIKISLKNMKQLFKNLFQFCSLEQ